MLCLQFHDGLYRELLVYMATAVPQQHRAARHTVDVVAQVVVGTEDNLLVLRERCHHNIRESLDSRSGVDIAHHLIARMLLLILLQILGTT